jgi:hypothetical protein
MRRTGMNLLVAIFTALGLVGISASPSLAQDALTAVVTIDGGTVAPRTGQATISGTVTCSEPVDFVFDANVVQNVGRVFIIRGYISQQGICPGPDGVSFTAPVVSDSAGFRPGLVNVDVAGYACAVGDISCERGFVNLRLQTTVRLRPAQ